MEKNGYLLPDTVEVKRYGFVNAKKLQPKTARPVVVYDVDGHIAVGSYNGKWWDIIKQLDDAHRVNATKVYCWCDFPQIIITKDTCR